MNNYLIVLMGTTGVGKSETAKELSKKGYEWISLDKIIKEKYPNKDNNSLNKNELEEVFEEFYLKTNKALKKNKNVVVDEWFYAKGDWEKFLEKIGKPDKNIHYFHLIAELEEIMKRNNTKENPLNKKEVTRHYKLTHNFPGESYLKKAPIKLNTEKMSPEEVSNHILNHLLFSEKLIIENERNEYF